jgi:acetyl-CoA acetyltransferase
MGDVFVAGAGTTRFGATGASLAALAHEAVRAALADAELAAADVTGVFVGCHGTGSVPGADALTLRLGLRRVGLVPGGSDGHEHVSAAGAQALHRAWRAVENGTCDVAVCVGAERLPSGASGAPASDVQRRRSEAARRYMAASGATVEQLAVAAAKNHAHGAGNPAVVGKVRVTPQAVLRSRMAAWPLTDLMVAPQGAGAAAVVLVGGAAPRHLHGRAPRVRASVLVSEADGADGAGARAAGLAYHLAGIGPHEVDCAEVHDETAAAELSAYEELQLVPRGEGPGLVGTGFTSLGGVLPVNASGGLLSLGQLHGASAVAQVFELVMQLRGRSGSRQVAGARTGLAMSRAPAPHGRDECVGLTLLTCG